MGSSVVGAQLLSSTQTRICCSTRHWFVGPLHQGREVTNPWFNRNGALSFTPYLQAYPDKPLDADPQPHGENIPLRLSTSAALTPNTVRYWLGLRYHLLRTSGIPQVRPNLAPYPQEPF